MKQSSKNIPVCDRQNLKEITVAILGNANSGKSTMVGILTNPILRNLDIPDKEILDNGKGSARSSILHYDHEQKTGRTSSITYNYMLRKTESNEKIISFVDLAGHEAYLKTTVSGVSSSYPDYGLVCIEKSITKITLEHLRLLNVLHIPFALIMSKIDIMPIDKLKNNIKEMMKYIKKIGKFGAVIKTKKEVSLLHDNMVPIVLTSNKTGAGYDNLICLLEFIEKRSTKMIPAAFVIDSVYTVPNIGLVVSGIAGITISEKDELFIGPFSTANQQFLKVKIRSIHDDYRNFIDKLETGNRGCLCFRIDNNNRRYIRAGLVLTKSPADVNPVKKFMARIHIFNGTRNTITAGYNTVINTGVIRSTIRFNKIMKVESSEPVEYTRAGEVNIIEAEFLKNMHCLNPGQLFIFREGVTIGYGVFL